MGEAKPSWQVEDCPTWCMREHEENDRGGDRDHQSEGVNVPVVLRQTTRSERGELTKQSVSSDLSIARSQPQGERVSFVEVAVADDVRRGFEISHESAVQLMGMMQPLVTAMVEVAAASRPHSALGHLTPIEFELRSDQDTVAATS